MNPPDTSRVIAPRLAHRPDQGLRPGIGPHPFRQASRDDRFVEPLEQRDPLLERRGEIEFAAHRPLGDRGNLRLDPGIIGQFVEAFLPDHGRIHVGDEQFLLAIIGGLDDHVDALDRSRAQSG